MDTSRKKTSPTRRQASKNKSKHRSGNIGKTAAGKELRLKKQKDTYSYTNTNWNLNSKLYSNVNFYFFRKNRWMHFTLCRTWMSLLDATCHRSVFWKPLNYFMLSHFNRPLKGIPIWAISKAKMLLFLETQITLLYQLHYFLWG